MTSKLFIRRRGENYYASYSIKQFRKGINLWEPFYKGSFAGLISSITMGADLPIGFCNAPIEIVYPKEEGKNNKIPQEEETAIKSLANMINIYSRVVDKLEEIQE